MKSQEITGLRVVEFGKPDEAEAYLSQIARSIQNVAFKTDEEPFRISYAGGTIGHCSMHRGSHSAMRYQTVESDEYHVVVPLRSNIELKSSKETIAATALRSGLLLTPGTRASIDVGASISGISLIAPAAAIAAFADLYDGEHTAGRFLSDRPQLLSLGDPIFSALARNMTSTFHELMLLRQNGLGTLASASLDEFLLGLLSAVVVGRAAPQASARSLSLGAAVVRRACDRIRAEASEPLRIAELARDLGVSLRALQAAFQREIGCSPREFLMQCRIEQARARLLDADERGTVAAIALECGFADLSHFSRRYRETYGELPSTTLQRRR